MTDSARTPLPTSADKLASLFEDPSAADRPWWRRHRRAGFVVVAIAVALVVLLATNAFGSDSNSYRVAVVGDHDVDALQSGVATIEPVSQATVAFPVAGTVSAVNVKVGDQVAVGQALASLNPQSLMDNLHAQEAALAQAQLTLSKALSGQSVGSAGGTGGSGGSGGTGSGGANAALSSARTAAAPTAVLTAATPTDPQLATLQQAVVSAQQGVDAALAASKTALDNATAVCASAGAGKTGPPPTTVPPATGSTGSAGTPGASPQDAGLTACQTALSNVLTAQHAADTAQHKLADASTALDAYLAQKAATPAPTPTTTPSATSGGTGRTGAGGSGGSGGSGSSGGSSGGFGATSRSTAPTAADIASYQAAVDAATANVAAAYQAVAQGTITTPIQGTVVAVGLTPGAAVTAGSTTADVVVQGAGGFEVTTSVNVTKISNVAVGQKASVVPDGSHTALPGKVTSISVAPTSVTNTATNYRVVVGLDNPNRKLGNGSTGTVTIVTKSAKASLAVPTSALTPLGRRYTVNVLQDGTPQTVVVGVGVVGATWTEVTSGLTRGQEVVLADLSQPLPSSATSSSNGTTGTNGANGLNGIGGGRFFFGGGAGGGGIRVPGGGAGR